MEQAFSENANLIRSSNDQSDVVGESSHPLNSSRNAGLDLLKLFAMFLIVLSHCVQSLGELHPSLNVDQSAFIDLSLASLDPTIIILVLLRGVGVLGNIMFLLCSVWFLTSSRTTKYQKIFQLLLDTFFISVLFMAGYLISGVNLSWKQIVKSLLPTLFANNWYITCYLLLYLVHPLLNAAIGHMGRRFASHIALILSFLYFVVDTILPGQYYGNNLIIFLAIYMVMGILQRRGHPFMDKALPNAVLILVGLAGYVAEVLVTELVGVKLGYFASGQLRWLNNGNVTFLLIGFGAFNLFRRMPFKSKALGFLSSHTLFIYLSHENFLFKSYTRPLVFPWIYDTFGYGHLIGWTLLVSLALFASSLILSLAYKQTLGRLSAWLSNMLSSFKLFSPLELEHCSMCPRLQAKDADEDPTDKGEGRPR